MRFEAEVEVLRHQVNQLTKENTRLRSIVGVIKRAVQEAPESVIPLHKEESTRDRLIRSLAISKGNRNKAAKIMGIARSSLYLAIKKYDLPRVRSGNNVSLS